MKKVGLRLNPNSKYQTNLMKSIVDKHGLAQKLKVKDHLFQSYK